jgi:hypothetical protein
LKAAKVQFEFAKADLLLRHAHSPFNIRNSCPPPQPCQDIRADSSDQLIPLQTGSMDVFAAWMQDRNRFPNEAQQLKEANL